MADRTVQRINILELVGKDGAAIQLRAGPSITRAAILAETQDGYNNPPLGSLYFSTGTGGLTFRRVAIAGASTDWQLISSSAADS